MDNKIVRKIFTIADYDREEIYLRKMHQSGWKLIRIQYSCYLIAVKYTFEKCPPEDVVYQLDFRALGPKNKETYLQLFTDFGWEHIQTFNNFSFFRKPATSIENQADLEIYSDESSKLDMIRRLLFSRFIPALFVLILNSYLILKNIEKGTGKFLFVFQIIDVLLLLTVSTQLLYIAIKLFKKRRELEEKNE
ncbi:MAG: DUF2812 domain-containing protein [Streptococcus sp.]|nr:DUF2812 domain-containing protein [Streptococcus sp.]